MVRRCLAAILVAGLASCSAAPAPVAPAAPSASAVAVPPAAPEAPGAKLGLLIDGTDDGDTPANKRPAPVAAASLPVFTGHWEPVKLPREVGPLLTVTGTTDRDVWLLAAGGPVMRWDGARVADRGTPRCFTDVCCGRLIDCARQPGRCRKKEICQSYDRDCADPAEWSFFESTPSGVVVGASRYTGGLTSSIVHARPGPGGWSCEQGKDDAAYPDRALEVTLDGVAIRFEGPVFLANRIGGYHLTIAGRAVALPEDLGDFADFMVRSPGDLWLWSTRSGSGHVWHGNGLTWSTVPTGLDRITQVWATEPGLVWALGEGSDCDGPEELLQWDVENGTEQRFCVPGARSVIAGPSDFWLFGENAALHDDGPSLDTSAKSFYFWDGRGLHRADAPLAFGSAWRGPSGDLWVVGAERATTKKLTGAAHRLVATVEKKP